MANPDRDTVYTNDGTNRTIYSRESNSTGWFVGIIVALALLAIAYLVFSANTASTTNVDVNNPAGVTAPVPNNAVVPPPADTTVTPNTTAPAPATTAPTNTAPTSAAPATSTAPTVSSAPPASTPATSSIAP